MILKIFPRTIEILNDRQMLGLIEQFKRMLREELMVPDSVDSSRWLPVFLKVRGVDRSLLEIAEFEYLTHLVRSSVPLKSKLDRGQIAVNANIQFVELHSSQPVLKRPAGLFCFYLIQDRFCEHQVSVMQALVIDILQAERKFTRLQLIEQACLHAMGRHKARADWELLVDEMLQLGLLELGKDLSNLHQDSTAGFGLD